MDTSILVRPSPGRTDMVMECLFEAHGQPVARAVLVRRLGRDPSDEDDNWLHGTIYRLRRRIERATTLLVPLQSVSKVGYVFRVELHVA